MSKESFHYMHSVPQKLLHDPLNTLCLHSIMGADAVWDSLLSLS